MAGRDPAEEHRASTPLELLFDLCFVVAVAQAAGALHHDLVAGQIGHGALNYLIVFFAIWWPWMNFTWFASAYDTDDVAYRVLTFVQITGVLVVTAGIPSAFDRLDFTVMVIGYVIMRIGLIGQWLRAAYEHPAGRATTLRFAIGIAVVQVAWALRLGIQPPLGTFVIFALGVAELAVPVWAERSGPLTPWHPGHVAERYGLFTLIVLGECVLAASTAVQLALAAGGVSVSLLAVAGGGLLLVFGLWWSYFKHPAEVGRNLSFAAVFAWGYGHYLVFASLAALGAGLQVALDATHQAVALDSAGVAFTVAIPLAIYLVTTGALHSRSMPFSLVVATAVGAIGVLLLAFAATPLGVPTAVLAMGVAVSLTVAFGVVTMHQRAPDGLPAQPEQTSP